MKGYSNHKTTILGGDAHSFYIKYQFGYFALLVEDFKLFSPNEFILF